VFERFGIGTWIAYVIAFNIAGLLYLLVSISIRSLHKASPVALEEFRSLRIQFISYQENIDTTSPLGQALFTIVSTVAQLERDLIGERVKAGLPSWEWNRIVLLGLQRELTTSSGRERGESV